MRNQSNPQALRADKRFEAVVKQEMIEHQHIISSHHKEMQALRDSLSMAMQKFDSLFEHQEKELIDFKEWAGNEIALAKSRSFINETIIAEQKKTITDLHAQLLSFQEDYSTKKDVENLKKEFGVEFRENTIRHINYFQDFGREFKTLIFSTQNDLSKFKDEIEMKIAQLTATSEANFNLSRLDKDGVLRQIQISEKAVFIIEKKIENIYTLIERINKRGEICHKPE